MPAYAVVLDTPAAEVRARNRARPAPVTAKVVAAQLREAADVAARLEAEGFAAVHRAAPVALVPPAYLAAPAAAARQQEEPMTLDFGLQVSRFDWPGHPAGTRFRAGFRSPPRRSIRGRLPNAGARADC